jgi:hypothetical protein
MTESDLPLLGSWRASEPALQAIERQREQLWALRERVALLEAKVEALERLPRPAVPAFTRDPRTND